MPDTTTTGALAIAYGDMRQTYQIVDRLGISILRDPYSYKPYVGFYMRKARRWRCDQRRSNEAAAVLCIINWRAVMASLFPAGVNLPGSTRSRG